MHTTLLPTTTTLHPLMASFQDNLGKLVPESYQTGFIEARDDRVLGWVASAGPDANNLHLAPGR